MEGPADPPVSGTLVPHEGSWLRGYPVSTTREQWEEITKTVTTSAFFRRVLLPDRNVLFEIQGCSGAATRFLSSGFLQLIQPAPHAAPALRRLQKAS